MPLTWGGTLSEQMSTRSGPLLLESSFRGADDDAGGGTALSSYEGSFGSRRMGAIWHIFHALGRGHNAASTTQPALLSGGRKRRHWELQGIGESKIGGTPKKIRSLALRLICQHSLRRFRLVLIVGRVAFR